MIQQGKVSIVIPCYEQAHWLPDAIESALAQTYDDVEVIVVNDGSTDDTTEVALGYPVTLVVQPNKGLSAARNSGIGVARGEYILPLDADDKIDPTYAEKALPLFQPGIGIVNSHQQNFGDDDSVYALRPVYSVRDILPQNQIVCCSFFPKKLWEKVGGYDENMRHGYEDWEFWIRILKPGLAVRTIPEPLFHYRKHGRSMISDTLERHPEIVDYIRQKHFGLYREVGLV